MLTRVAQSRSYSASAGGLGLNAVLFLGLICFLLFWSFFGKTIEKRVYGQSLPVQREGGDLGAEIIFSQAGSVTPLLIVGRVYPDSPAERAGLKTGDRIVGLNGRLVSSMDMARHIISSNGSGASLKVTINRDGRNKEIHVRLNDQSPANKALKSQSLPLSKKILVVIIFLKLTVIMFYLIYKNIVNRTLIVLLFATAILFMGILLRVYTPLDAFFAIKFNTISLLMGMGIISVVLDEAGFFDYVAYRICKFAGKSRLKILILFCLITFCFSLLVNNLSTILVMVPMTLKLADILGFDPRPFIIGEIISSNLGGASTMVGDFPNMLISSETGIGFNQFIIFMMPICLILFGILLIYIRLKIGDFAIPDKEKAIRNQIRGPKRTYTERKAAKRAVFVLCHVIFLFMISGKMSLNPSAIALLGGLSLFLFSGIDRSAVVSRAGFNDILFFIGLFIMVGGLEASGLLRYISEGIVFFSFGKPWLQCLVLMWSAAFLTAFLNAGPTTALFFPVVLGFSLAPPHHTIWWALSLGVLAGSSATICGATAGPVAATLVERFSSHYRLSLSDGNTITYGQFAKIGVPVMLLFLSVSSVYVTCLCLYF